MSITEDFTVSEKQMIKELANKAREKIHSNWKLKLCMESSRSPKNVLVLKETDRTELIKSNTIRKSILNTHSILYYPTHQLVSAIKTYPKKKILSKSGAMGISKFRLEKRKMKVLKCI